MNPMEHLTEAEGARQGPITAREATAEIPDLENFCGGGKALDYFKRRLEHPFEGDANVILLGLPGTGKTHLVESYLKLRFNNPLFHNGDFEDRCRYDDFYRSLGAKIERAAYDVRFFQTNNPGKIYAYIRIDGASDSPKTIAEKVNDALYHESANHAIVFIDEAGELYRRGLEECLRPVMTAGNITVYATAQDIRGKHRSDTEQEDADRRRAFVRRFTWILDTVNPSASDLLRYLARKIRDWHLKVDSLDTLRLLVRKSGCVVGYAIRSLIKAIDEPDRRLTVEQVLRDDADPVIF